MTGQQARDHAQAYRESKEIDLLRLKAYRKYERRRVEAWRCKNPEKHRAIQMVAFAILDEKLKRGPCEKCGTNDRVCGFHHHGYANPLDVVWRCRPCNNRSKRLEKRREALSDINDGHRPIGG